MLCQWFFHTIRYSKEFVTKILKYKFICIIQIINNYKMDEEAATKTMASASLSADYSEFFKNITWCTVNAV